MQGQSLEAIFKSFANGKNDMESKQFSKLVKECKLIDKKFTNNDVDIVFAKVKVKGLKTITFADFQNALGEIAKKKGTTLEAIKEVIEKHGAATYAGTKADYVKFHDDKTTYTGVYARGGPTTVDAGRGGMISDISQTCNRSEADVRGVVKKKK